MKLAHEKKFEHAVERFIQALLLDPRNAAAKEQLQRIANSKAINSAAGLRILRLIDQIDYLIFLEERLDHLRNENKGFQDALEHPLALLGDAVLNEKFLRLKERSAQALSDAPVVSNLGFLHSDFKEGALDTLVNKLAEERKSLSARVGLFQEQNDQLRDLRRDVVRRASSSTAANPTHLRGQVEELRARAAEKDELLNLQKDGIDVFKAELTKVREEFSALQDRLKETDQRVTDLNQRIASMSIELYEKDKIIADKERHSAGLEQALATAQEKISLNQRIIQEKDERIAALEKQRSRSELPDGGGVGVAEMRAQLEEFESRFKEQLEKSRDRIIILEMRYAELERQYQDVVSMLSERNRVAHHYRTAFLNTDQKLNQLIGMVEIYRGKLLEARESLSVKETELQQLQNVLDQFSPDPAPAAEQPLGRSGALPSGWAIAAHHSQEALLSP